MKKRLWYVLKFSRLLPGGICACLVLPLISAAQTDTTKSLKEVNVSSSRSAFIETIAPSQSITANDFVRYGAFNVADAIRNFSGVSIRDYGGVGGLKTVSVRGLGANHVAVIYDGVAINDAENGQVDLGKLNLTNVHSITLYNGQSPNVLQPARSYASASVLDIQTIKPGLSARKPYQITAGVKTGSLALLNPYLHWQQRLSDQWAFVVNGYSQHADGKYDFQEDNGNTLTERTRNGSAIAAHQIEGVIYWAKSDSNKFNARVNYYNSDRGLPGPVVLYAPPPEGQRLWNKDLFFQANYQRIWKSNISLLVNTKFAKNDLRYFDPQFPNTAGYLDQQFTQREFYGSAAVAYKILPNWEVSYASDLVVNTMGASLYAFKYPIRVTLLNAIATNFIYKKLTLQASLLNTDLAESVTSGKTIPHTNVFSPTVMATVKPWADAGVQLRGFYKEIFRAPTFNELYYGFVVNTNLKPEYTKQFDLGFTYNKNLTGLFQYITFTADAYYNKVTNKIVYTPNLYNGSTQNHGKVDIEGLDAGLKTQLKLGNGYQGLLSVNYSYQKAINVTDPTATIYLNQLPYIPLHTVSYNVGVSKGHFGVYCNQLISSQRYYTNNNLPDDSLPAYAIADASVIYKGAVKNLPMSLSAEVNNVLDKRYTIIQSYPMPGCSFRISFQITI